jgi:predicted alpha/beta superfamily hydrolase
MMSTTDKLQPAAYNQDDENTMAKRKNDRRAFLPGEEIVAGKTVAVKSKLFDRSIDLKLRFPLNFDKKTESCPAIYVLDGGRQFLHMTGLLDLMEHCNQIPRMIYVGIDLPDRWYCSTPSGLKPLEFGKHHSPRRCGGAAEFADSLEAEIIPFVERSYKASSFRILGGFSLTGLFTAWTFLNRSELFNCYHASTPSIWFNAGELIDNAPALLRKTRGNRQISIDVGDEHKRHVMYIRKFAKVLKEKAPKRIRTRFEQFKDEGHVSVTHRGLHEALRFFFHDWNLETVIKQPTAAQLKGHYGKLSKRYSFRAAPSIFFLLQVVDEWMKKGKWQEAKKCAVFGLEAYPRSGGLLDMMRKIQTR